MAFSLPNLFRCVIVLLLAAHVFVMYCIARTMDGEIDPGFGTVLLASGFALVMLLPFVWAVALPEFPEMYLRHVRGRKRYDEGRCPTCGYTPGVNDATRCSECGEPLRKPEAYHIGFSTIRLFIMINILAWVLGCAAGEAWCQNEERLFNARRDGAATIAADACIAAMRDCRIDWLRHSDGGAEMTCDLDRSGQARMMVHPVAG